MKHEKHTRVVVSDYDCRSHTHTHTHRDTLSHLSSCRACRFRFRRVCGGGCGSGPAPGRPLPPCPAPGTRSARPGPAFITVAASSGQTWQRLAFPCTSTLTLSAKPSADTEQPPRGLVPPHEMKVARRCQSESLCRMLLYLRVKILLRSDAHTLHAFCCFYSRNSPLFSACPSRSERGRI